MINISKGRRGRPFISPQPLHSFSRSKNLIYFCLPAVSISFSVILFTEMWSRLLIITAFCCVAAWAASTKSVRPSPCPVGSSYQKDCNTCQCGDTASKDKCSQRDCARLSSSTTERPKTGVRPGVCGTRVTPRPGSKDCENREKTNQCTVDKDCPGAKKCCIDGCNRYLCKNPVYNYVNGTKFS